MKRKAKKKSPTKFRWITKKGEALLPEQMATPHIFNAIKMMYNNTMPSALRVGHFISWPDVKYWPTTYLEKASFELTKELLTRTDFENVELFNDMLFNIELLSRANQGKLSIVLLRPILTGWEHYGVKRYEAIEEYRPRWYL